MLIFYISTFPVVFMPLGTAYLNNQTFNLSYIYVHTVFMQCATKTVGQSYCNFGTVFFVLPTYLAVSPEAQIKLGFQVLFDPPRSERFHFEVTVQLYVNLSSEVCNSLFICRKLNIRTFNNVPFVPVLWWCFPLPSLWSSQPLISGVVNMWIYCKYKYFETP